MPGFWRGFSDLNALKATGRASLAVMGLDAAFVGTTDFMGVASFWNYEYQNYLRDATCKQWQRDHTAMLKAGLLLQWSRGETEFISNSHACLRASMGPRLLSRGESIYVTSTSVRG